MTKTEPERNYVADAYNWEQRIKGENESARVRIMCLIIRNAFMFKEKISFNMI